MKSPISGTGTDGKPVARMKHYDKTVQASLRVCILTEVFAGILEAHKTETEKSVRQQRR